MAELNAEAVRRAIMAWPSRYETKTGRKFKGELVSATPKSLIEAGWRRVSHLGEYEFERMGLEIVDAQYVNGAHPTGRFVRVILVEEVS